MSEAVIPVRDEAPIGDRPSGHASVNSQSTSDVVMPPPQSQPDLDEPTRTDLSVWIAHGTSDVLLLVSTSIKGLEMSDWFALMYVILVTQPPSPRALLTDCLVAV
jgi:hypothetical protein